jgi:transcriptional regulator with XRE-family HTH domain
MPMETIDRVKFGNAIREARKKMNFTQEQLAEHANKSVKTIANIETGKGKPTEKAINAISKALGCSVSELTN